MSSSEPKTKRKKTAPYSEEDLKKALAEIRLNKKPVRQICREYNIPKTTVLDRISGRTTDNIKKPGPDPVLGKEGEKKVVEWLINISKCGFPVKKQELLDTIQKIIRDSEIKNSFKDDRPGEKWFQKFLVRNKEISLKNSEGINKARALVTEQNIRLWFKELEDFLGTIGQKDILNHPERIFNGDESGFALCPKTGKVLGPRGYRNLYQIKHGNEKENITVLLTFNANGDVCPPCVVFPYVRPPKAVVKSMPPEWCLGKSETGWMRGDVFFEYITNDFNNWIEQNNIKKPVLLLVDGHKSHMSLMLSTLCEEMQILLYALPPNTTHILQPADVSVFAPLKSCWKNTVRNFLSKPENFNSAVTKTNFCTLLSDTLKQSSMSDNIKNGFKRCGLYPFDPNSPDYTKCVRNTLEKLNLIENRPSNKNKINYSDIASTKKVLKHLKSILKEKKINTRIIMKEINILKKSLPMEEENIIEISMETVSENNGSSLIDLSNLEQNTGQNNTRTIECDLDARKEISISSFISQDEEQNADGNNSEPYLVIETVSAQIHPPPKNAIEQHATTSSTCNSDYNVITNINCDEIAEIHHKDNDVSNDQIEENNSISTLHISESYLELGSIVSLDDILVLPFQASSTSEQTETVPSPPPELSLPHSTLIAACSALSELPTKENSPALTPSQLILIASEGSGSETVALEIQSEFSPAVSTLVASNNSPVKPTTNEIPLGFSTPSTSKASKYSTGDPFQDHLMLPEVFNTVRTSKQRTPAAISSAAWRKYYENKEQIQNEKKEATRKRKLERTEKQKKQKNTLKENQNLNKITQKRKKNTNTGTITQKTDVLNIETTKENVPAVNKIKCGVCDDILISDVEDDDEKNLGCDECIRWYHLKCTKFAGLAYLQIKDQPFKCNFCD